MGLVHTLSFSLSRLFAHLFLTLARHQCLPARSARNFLSLFLSFSLEGTRVKGCMGREGDDRGDRGGRVCRGISGDMGRSGDLDHMGGRELARAQTLRPHGIAILSLGPRDRARWGPLRTHVGPAPAAPLRHTHPTGVRRHEPPEPARDHHRPCAAADSSSDPRSRRAPGPRPCGAGCEAPRGPRDVLHPGRRLRRLRRARLLLATLNFRVVQAGSYPGVAATDALLATFGFLVVRRVARSEEAWHLWLGYMLGGVVGGVLGLWVSRALGT